MITTNFKASDVDLGADFVPYEQSGLIPAADKKTTHPSWASPDPFTFTPVNNAARSTDFTSNTVTITGLTPNISVVVDAFNGLVDSGTAALSGTFSTSKTVTTSATGTIVVAAKGTSSSEFTTPISVTVVIGRQRSVFVITTGALNSLPNAFSFTNVSNAATSYVYTSNTVTITGLTASYSFTVSATGGTVDAGTSSLSGTFAASKTVTTSPTGTLVVAVRTTSSSSYTTATNVTVTVGTGQSVWTVTTSALDTTPDAFSLGSVTNANIASVTSYYDSSQILITGLTPNYVVSVSASGSGYVNAGTSSTNDTWYSSLNVTTSLSGTLVLKARCYTSSSYNTTTSVTVTVNGVSSTFYVTTIADTTPDAFSFTNQTNTDFNTYITSNTVTVTGLSANYAVTINSSGSDSTSGIDAGTSSLSGTFATSKIVTTSSSGTLVLAARIKSAVTGLTTKSVVVTIGGVSATFSVTTSADHGNLGWGSAVLGAYGPITNYTDSMVPAGPIFTQPISVMSTGQEASYLITNSGSLYVSGRNTNGMLGTSNVSNSVSNFTQVGGTWTMVAGSNNAGYYALGAKSDGRLWAWGSNGNGVLGLGDTVSRSSPTIVASAFNVDTLGKKLVAGWMSAAAISNGSALYVWGDNTYGQLGLSDTTHRSSPAFVSGSWRDVGIGTSHMVAIRADQTLWSWGYNNNGQLGINAVTPQKSSPVQIGSLGSWTSCSVAANSAAAIRNGALYMWGDNTYGQLGLSDSTPRSSPTQVGSLTNWSKVNVAPGYTIALKTDGTAWAWGFASYGQLGINRSNTASPVQIGTGNTWTTISAGVYHAIGVAT